MYDRLDEVKRQHENKKKSDFFGVTLHPRDIDWLIEQAEKTARYEGALEEIIDILEGQNVTPLVERIAFVLAGSGVYEKK